MQCLRCFYLHLLRMYGSALVVCKQVIVLPVHFFGLQRPKKDYPPGTSESNMIQFFCRDLANI